MHFETKCCLIVSSDREYLHCTSRALMSSHLDDFSDTVTYCNDKNIFLWGGVVGASTPQII